MIKLVATDLDDTLLNDEWKISRNNIEAVRLAVAKGVIVTLATGRMAASCRKYARELGLDVPIITYQGALIERGLGGETLYKKTVSSELAAEIVEILLKKGIHTQVFIGDRVFVQKAGKYSAAYSEMSGVTIEEFDLLTLLEKEPEGPEKILCIGEEDVLRQLYNEFKDIYSDRLHFTSSKPYYLDMLDKEVNKANALLALCRQFKIKPEEVMAIGDSLNDLEMLTFAGTSIAMGNAHPEVKKIADYITASNNEDGVARAIERFVL